MKNLKTIFLVSTFLHLNADIFAQKVTLFVKDATLRNVLREITTQSGYDFLYSTEDLKNAQHVDVSVKNEDLADVLKKIFKNQPLDYSIGKKSVVISKKNTEKINNIALQQDLAAGTVKNGNGQALSGINVTIKGSSATVQTDKNGYFKIAVNRGIKLVFSAIGYQTKELNASNDMQIVLQQGNNQLEETVVVGYGSTKRKDLTGSIASVKVSEIKDVPFMSVDDALTGKAPGVQVTKADGSPGGAVRIRVRGGTSLVGTNDPLYIIDGIPTIVTNNYSNSQSDIVNPIEAAGPEGFNNSVSGAFNRGLNNLAGLNFNDIETIDILKDASATAIYGSKAANGVVIITTKRGKQNMKPQLNLNYYTGINSPIAEKVMNAAQYKSLLKESAHNLIDERSRVGLDLDNSSSQQALRIINDPNFFGTADTDWLRLVLRSGYTTNADISVTGGGSDSRYYTSLNYTKQSGTILGSDFKRLAGKVNLDNQIGSKFKLITNINYGYTDNNLVSGAYGQALTAPPTIGVYNEDGTYTNLGELSADYRGFQNPYALTTTTNNAKDYLLLGSISGEYDILKDLKFKSTISANLSLYNQINYTPSYVEVGGFYGRESTGGGLGSNSNTNALSTFIENTLTWNKSFNDEHRLTLLGGTSWERNRASSFSATGRGYTDDFYLNNLSSAAIPVSVRGANPTTRNALLSFYLRANYIYNDKYLFTFTGRSDASSKFGPSNQTGYFPSGAIAWRIAEENFLKDSEWIDELKLRASMGRTGTQAIGDNMWRTLYSPDSYGNANALIPTQLGNTRIKWESTTQQDLALDYSFFQGRISGTMGYYRKLTDGALLNLSPAPSSSYSSVIYNIAKIENKGLEFDIQGVFVQKDRFRWNGALNISRNISKVLNVDGGPFSDPRDRNALNLGTSIVREGDPLGLLYGQVSNGIIKTVEELNAYKQKFPDYEFYQPLVNLGDIAYEIAEDGYYKQDVIGKSIPKFYGGYTNTLNYSRFALTTLFTFSYGGQLLYQKDVTDMNMETMANAGVRLMDRYNANNTNSNRPRLLYGESVYLTNRNVYDASYLKLKSLNFSYAVPNQFLEKYKIKNLNIYASVMNLFVITKYPGPDPEVSDDPRSVIGGGRDMSTFPTSRTYTIGFRLGF
ncbi:SusC/RagA family TonB-linked outer membrane protein [Sphingobacterium sp.]|uniref:SusC/RagA family TonB-linked outer membrane protein n=1 Tax=Sphingobacterium sp. TaxID=341027 RepID=UPI00289B6DB8|nr:SusC/RagA family TonB-linked outer membrane protein [Sphingobacterium sp.]